MSAIRWGFVLSSSLANPPCDKRHQIAFFFCQIRHSRTLFEPDHAKRKLDEMGGLSMKQSQLSIKLREEVEKKYGTLRRWAPFIIVIIMIIIIVIVSSSLPSWSSSSFIIHSLIQFNSNWLLSRPTKEWTETKTRRVESLPKGWT